MNVNYMTTDEKKSNNKAFYIIFGLILILSIILSSTVTFLLLKPSEVTLNPYQKILDMNTNYTSTITVILNETDNYLSKYRQSGNITYLSNARDYLYAAINTQLLYEQWYTFNISNNPKYDEISSDIFSSVHFYDRQIDFRMIDVIIELRR